MNNPENWKTNSTVQEITETEVEDEETYWIFNHRELMTNFIFLLDPLREEVDVGECGDSDDVADSTNDADDSNDKKHPILGVLHRLWLAADLRPVWYKC